MFFFSSHVKLIFCGLSPFNKIGVVFTVFVTQLKEFYGSVSCEFRRVLDNMNTQFLALLPVTERILQIHEGLMPFVFSQNAAQ